MYGMGGIEDWGRKVIKAADSVSATAQRVSGAIKGAAVGAKEPEARKATTPVLLGVIGILLLLKFRGRK